MAIDNKRVAENIQAIRIRAAMTQQQMASVLNVSHQAVSKWETGAALPDIQTVLLISQIFGVSMEQILNGEIALEEEAPMEGVAESNEPESFGKWLKSNLPDGTMDMIRSAAAATKKTVSDIGEKAGKAMAGLGDAAESAVNGIGEKAGSMFERIKKSCTTAEEAEEMKEEAFEEPECPETEEETEADQAAALNFENLCAMAPFMSREKLSEIVSRIRRISDWESILKIAPFVSRATVRKLSERCLERPAEIRVLKRLAPFSGAETIYKLLLENLSALDWESLRALAPFLGRDMVDQLTDYLITGKEPQKEETAEKKKKEGISSAVQSVVSEVEKVLDDVGKAVSGIFSRSEKKNAEDEKEAEAPACEEAEETEEVLFREAEEYVPETEEAPSNADGEMKNRIAKAALVSGNWIWINSHLFEITDTDLVTEIAVKAVRDFAAEDNAAIAVRAASVLNEEQRKTLFKAVIEEKAWSIAIALKSLADEEIASEVVKKACEAEGAERENAYLAVENFARHAGKETVQTVTEKAIQDENWVLINALTDAF